MQEFRNSRFIFEAHCAHATFSLTNDCVTYYGPRIRTSVQYVLINVHQWNVLSITMVIPPDVDILGNKYYFIKIWYTICMFKILFLVGVVCLNPFYDDI